MTLLFGGLFCWALLAWYGTRFSERCERLLALVAEREGVLLERRWVPPGSVRLLARIFTPLIGMPVQGCILIFAGILCAAYLTDERPAMRFLAAMGARGHLMGLGVPQQDYMTMDGALEAWVDQGWTDEP